MKVVLSFNQAGMQKNVQECQQSGSFFTLFQGLAIFLKKPRIALFENPLPGQICCTNRVRFVFVEYKILIVSR
jgi:hypothetical protein